MRSYALQLVLPLLIGASSLPGQEARPEWTSDLTAALQRARTQKRPMLAYVYDTA